MDDAEFRAWKQHLVPFLYDWISNHKLTWPSQTCRWGQKIDEAGQYRTKYRLYISEQTDGSEPQKLTVCTADVCKPRVAGPEAVSNWSEFSKSPYVKEHKVIFHPGEVNKVRELPQHPNVVITHTDLPELFVWNVDKQPSRQRKEDKERRTTGKAASSVPDLKLVGHKKPAQFPLATCSDQPLVASGGTDHLVLTWNIQDSMESVELGVQTDANNAPELAARTTLCGHSDTVEDVVFKPGSGEQLASVGDDHLFLCWDSRAGTSPVSQVAAAHGSQDIHCVDWSVLQQDWIATGAADGSLKIWDVRKLGGSSDYVFQFGFHRDAIMRVEWHPHARGILASGGDDRIVAVWDLNRSGENTSMTTKAGEDKPRPPQLMFQHLGHKNGKVVDFQWNPHDPWMMVSVSDDTEEGAGGGTLQLWRINDMIYRNDEEVLQELEEHRDFILNGEPAGKRRKATGVPPTAQPAQEQAAAQAAPAVEHPAGAEAPSALQSGPNEAGPVTAEAMEDIADMLAPLAGQAPASNNEQESEVAVGSSSLVQRAGTPSAAATADVQQPEEPTNAETAQAMHATEVALSEPLAADQ